jgi:hypothetical protein
MGATPAGEDERRASHGAAFERHYSVAQLATLWGMSDDFVRRLFSQERDVVVFFHYRPGRRTYRTLRIPASVAERVHCRMRQRER